MKFFAVFAAVLALSAAASTTQWTLHDLTQALENPATPAALIPYLQQALNTMMESAFAGQPIGAITVTTPGGLLPIEAVNPVEAAPTTLWTLNDLNTALQNPATPAALIPYLEHALNEMMEAMFAGQPIAAITVPTPAGLLPVEAANPVEAVVPVEAAPTTQWTLNDLNMALQNPETPAALIPYLEHALNEMLEAMFSGQPIAAITVPTPAGLLPVEAINPVEAVVPVEAAPTTQWTLNDLNMALQNPATPAALIPYLEHALNEMMDAMFAGQPIATITVPTPAGLLPVEAVSPIEVTPVDVIEVAEPVAPVVVPEPTPAVVADASGSPLVQIIVNIRSQEVAAETPAAVESPVLVPTPVIVAPSPTEVPSPVIVAPEVNPIDIISVTPVIPGPAVVPSPVIVAPEVNPIDVIAVVDTETNPLDLLQPVPVAVAGGASQGIQV